MLHASAHALQHLSDRGKILVLDMGEPVRIADLAERMIQLAGFRPHEDIEIVYHRAEARREALRRAVRPV